MTIILNGGGSGGHITPLLAVADELKQLQPDTKLIYIGQKGDSLYDLVRDHPSINKTYVVSGGKFRRYHAEGWKQIFDIPSQFKNSVDAVRVVRGFLQSRRLLKRLKPQAIFIRGGLTAVPVGLAAASLHIPYITHDSDAIPGLANRIIARWARFHAVALPKEVYSYPQANTVTVGVPVSRDFKLVTADLQHQYRKELGLEDAHPVVLVTGGGLGAQPLNDAVAAITPELFKRFERLVIIQSSGKKHEAELQEYYRTNLPEELQKQVIVKGFISDLYRYSGAADLIISRGGATTIAEFAMQGKACLIVPNPVLTGGHQLKNAELLKNQKAAQVFTNEDLSNNKKLSEAVISLLEAEQKRRVFGENLHTMANPHSAQDIARLIIETE